MKPADQVIQQCNEIISNYRIFYTFGTSKFIFMHELSIAVSIVEIAEEYASKADSSEVKEIELDIGALSGVVIEALEFAFKSAVEKTVLENASVKINYIMGKARCLDCDTVFDVEDLYTPCPSCNSFHTEVIEGRELRVKSLTVE